MSTTASTNFSCVRLCRSEPPVPYVDAKDWIVSSFRKATSCCLRTMSKDKVSAANHTMPARDTVARVAWRRESVSIIMRTFGGILRRSPDGKVSNLLSSKTEFKFSAHSGSTSPSKRIQLRFKALVELSDTLRNKKVKIPSVHSPVLASNLP